MRKNYNILLYKIKRLLDIKHMKYFILSVLLILALPMGCEDSKEKKDEMPVDSSFISIGYGKFEFNKYAPLSNKPITVYTFLPNNGNINKQIIFVMHGSSRSVVNNCGYWSESATQYDFLVVCPEFNESQFPGSNYYKNGGMYINEQFTDSTTWAYNMIEEIFSYIKQSGGTTAETYGIYGFSGGGQFVHRYAIFTNPKHASIIIPAGSGWYTLPTYDEIFPYGLNNSPFIEKDLTNKFALPLVVLVGENDTDPNDSSLRKTKEAMRQGDHRYARAKYFYNIAETKAKSINAQFNWKLETVPNFGHSARNTAPIAAKIFNSILSN